MDISSVSRTDDLTYGLLVKERFALGVMAYLEMSGTDLTMLIVAVIVIVCFDCTCGWTDDNLTLMAGTALSCARTGLIDGFDSPPSWDYRSRGGKIVCDYQVILGQ